MYIFCGIITSVLTILLEFIFLQGSFSLHSCTMGVVIPAGGWVDGMLCASGIYLYMKIRHKRVKIRHRLFSVIISFVTFWLIYFMSYSTAFVENGRINHAFRGEHISNFSYNQAENYDFGHYLNLHMKSMRIISSSNGLIIAEHDMGIGFNKFLFLFELLGFCVGGLTAGFIAIEGREYCKKCKIDFIRKHLYSFPDERFDDEVKEISKMFKSKDYFKQYVGRRNNLKVDSPYYDVCLKYCAGCRKAYIEYRYMRIVRNRKGEEILEEDRDKYKVIEAPYDIC